MNHYELTYIVPMSYTVDELPNITSGIKELLVKNGGESFKETSLGKLKFAYPLKKLSHGYYQVVEFDLPPEGVSEIDKTLRLSNNVLRYLFVTKRLKTEEELAAEQKLREKIAEQDKNRKSIFDEETEEETTKRPKRVKKTVKPKEVKKEEKVDIEELDKKLDEILGGSDMLK